MSVAKIVRALVGIIVVVALGVVVMNLWGDYRSARAAVPVAPATSPGQASTTGTSTTPTSTVLGVGVTKIDGVNFRTQPSSGATLIRGLKKGEKVTVLLKDGQWYQVRDSKGTTGWVTANGDYVAIQGQ